MDEVAAYVKNDHLGFAIPYTIDAEQHDYLPDFLVRLDDGHGSEDLLTLIVEVSGAQRRDKQAKVSTARALWVPAVNAHGGFGRWAFVEVTDPWSAAAILRAELGGWHCQPTAAPDLPIEQMVELAKRYGVIEMALFGSVLGPDLGPDSDIDVLVDIDEGARISLWDFVRLKNELSDLVGREVDLVPKKQLKPFVRDEVLSSMRVVYAAT